MTSINFPGSSPSIFIPASNREENPPSNEEYEKEQGQIRVDTPYPTNAASLSSMQVSEDIWHKKVLSKLASHEISAKEIIDLLSENTRIKEYYAKPAGVVEGYTVRQHTEMVLELAQQYRMYFEPQISECIDWGYFLLFLALHDIGKGASKEIDTYTTTTAKELELKTTQKILTWILEQLWVSSSIGHIFQALLMYDSQGEYLKGNISAECFKGHLLDMSAVSKLAPAAFYKIYNIFHLVDAASYPNLRPLFVFGSETLQHCEGNQSLIEYLYQSFES